MSLNSRANSIVTHFKTKITTTAPQPVEMNALRLQLVPPNFVQGPGSSMATKPLPASSMMADDDQIMVSGSGINTQRTLQRSAMDVKSQLATSLAQ